jgi:hypothetical protein
VFVVSPASRRGDVSLAWSQGMMERDENLPGYAIGGLAGTPDGVQARITDLCDHPSGVAGGEEKCKFWPVVSKCTAALPQHKPRYLMGVGYPLDLVVCTALGVDMYDCVYPTRTARCAFSGGRVPWVPWLAQCWCSQVWHRVGPQWLVETEEREHGNGCRPH